jgi:Na+-driven multidrug efflux pump
MSISQATGALVGQALGSGHPNEARRVLRASIAMSLLVMTTLTAILVGFAEPVIALFGVDPASTLGQFAVTWLTLLGYGMPLAGVYISFVGLFQGAGQTRAPLMINGLAHLVFQVPLSWILGFPLGLGAWGVWVAFPLSFVIKLIAARLLYRRDRWANVGADV